jgi:beta-mannanase
MKRKIIIGIFFVIVTVSLSSKAEAYLFGMKSWDNSIENIQRIEKEYKLDLPIVSFIFDPRGEHVEKMMNQFNEKLGQDKIYHISLSPNMYTAKEVAEGAFDEQYRQFFQDVKKNNLRVIFRTMHEMNGGRYPRSSDPASFKKAWIHVREISREEGLNQYNILFDMSVNARDLPAKGGVPSQTATFLQCTQAVKAKYKCPTFEDYYPGDKYVDLMGVTFYNRGKGNSNRRRGTPDMIVNNAARKTLDRLKKLPKPIFVDEVGTTAVNYE